MLCTKFCHFCISSNVSNFDLKFCDKRYRCSVDVLHFFQNFLNSLKLFFKHLEHREHHKPGSTRYFPDSLGLIHSNYSFGSFSYCDTCFYLVILRSTLSIYNYMQSTGPNLACGRFNLFTEEINLKMFTVLHMFTLFLFQKNIFALF